MSASPGSDYSEWSREDLIKRIQTLENNLQTAVIPATTSTEQFVASVPKRSSSTEQSRKSNKKARAFNFSSHATHKVAFKISYFGFPYQGFASQAGSKNTIEYHLFSALTRSHLIGDIEHADYSRCGRTDKGVSAAGNVIALNVRTSRNPNDTSTLSKPELPYLSILNRLLPDDIRVLAWAPVNSDFSARFSCKHRVYKYFIPSLNLDIDRIREALKKLVGTHDFRNFCKLDPSKNIVTYDRTIFEASIEPVSEVFPNSSQYHAYSFNSSPNSLLTTSYSSFHVITIRGTAFLWHQIRCIVAVLLHVGQRLESPDIVDKLLDIKTCDSKPQFEMASEKGLVLWNCEFEE
ncbi:pseudouridine synthase, partial [Paraphysoderma sedebokerense]